MAFKKKSAPSASSLDLSAAHSPTPAQTNPGNAPVNSQGQVTDKSGLQVDWPNTPAVHDRDDDRVSSYAYDKSQSLDDDKGKTNLAG